MEFGRDLKLLVFDFDGTLLHLDVDWVDLRESLRPVQAGPDESLGTLIQRLNLTADPRLAVVTAAELRALADRRLDPTTVRVLGELAARHPIAVCTRNSRTVVERAVAGSPLAEVYIVGREDHPRLKPDPAGLNLILAHFGVAAAHAALVGDTYHDVQAARAAGVCSVVVRNARLAYPPSGADRYIERLDELLTGPESFDQESQPELPGPIGRTGPNAAR